MTRQAHVTTQTPTSSLLVQPLLFSTCSMEDWSEMPALHAVDSKRSTGPRESLTQRPWLQEKQEQPCEQTSNYRLMHTKQHNVAVHLIGGRATSKERFWEAFSGNSQQRSQHVISGVKEVLSLYPAEWVGCLLTGSGSALAIWKTDA